ncbi:MAG: DUF5819 family protein [Armatimonadota bacterium]|nr:DUF5819 family protein [Armatimonadota bacterium]MDR7485265.1 DUF5819 family protein [Armatimonadota bacterium]MDR7533897.1 DUF5819 family protein [Armatimonadota bacterium]MDR7537141.1 DUF5819 family protein [Armatimonadota bacterium]
MQRTIVRVAVLGLTALVAAYIVNTALYLAPPNPLTLRLLPVVTAVQHPWFSQNWHLFAPSPIRSNVLLTVRCRAGDRITPWYDPMTSWLAAHHRSRFTPMGKLLRLPMNAMLMVLGRTSDDWRHLLCRKVPDAPACRGADPGMQRQRQVGLRVLRRLASAACDRLVTPVRADAVQPRILIHDPPPWSRRHLPAEAGTTRYVLLPWMPYEVVR